MKYNLNDLHWQQFEFLSFNCLQRLVAFGIQFIEGGSDKGRDIIYEGKSQVFQPTWDGKWIFQIKHKGVKGKDQTKAAKALLSDLKSELEKVFIKNKLDFYNYILVTNLSATGDLNDKAEKIFQDFCKDNEVLCKNFFVFGYRHFESCVDNHQAIKWSFPTILHHPDFEVICRSIFETVIHNRNIGWFKTINKYRKYFVYTNFYFQSYERLNNYDAILLSGPPKCGKTFNAEMLIYNFVGEYNYSPLKIDHPEEIEKYYKSDDTKQIFFCDDAFGSHRLSYSNAEEWDRKIENILSLADKNHKFVFTSREHILNAFRNYANSFSDNQIEKIIINNEDLTLGEKSAILDRYVKLSVIPENKGKYFFEKELNIISHKYFSPESIRAFFSNLPDRTSSGYSNYQNLILHLDKPDGYLKNLFFNLDDTKRILLLGVLCALNPNIKEIGKAYSNLCEDFGTQKIESYKNILDELEGGILKALENEDYEEVKFYHPSMKEGLIQVIKDDENGTIHRSVLKNLNFDLLEFYFFQSPKSRNTRIIGIKQNELDLFAISINRLIQNESFQFHHVIRLLKWFTITGDSLLKVLDKSFYDSIKNVQLLIINYIKSDSFWQKFKDETTSSWSELIWCLKSLSLAYSYDLNLFYCEYWNKLLDSRKSEDAYWRLVFRLSNFIEESKIIEIVGKEWLNNFYLSLRKRLYELGYEIFDKEYPDFPTYNKLSPEEKVKTPKMKHKPNRTWYPRFLICKENFQYLKEIKGNKIGQPIITRLEKEYEALLRFSDYAYNRHTFNEEQKWW